MAHGGISTPCWKSVNFSRFYKILENKEVLVADFEGAEQALAVLRDALVLYRNMGEKTTASG